MRSHPGGCPTTISRPWWQCPSGHARFGAEIADQYRGRTRGAATAARASSHAGAGAPAFEVHDETHIRQMIQLNETGAGVNGPARPGLALRRVNDDSRDGELELGVPNEELAEP